MSYYNREPKRDHNFDNHPYVGISPKEYPEAARPLPLGLLDLHWVASLGRLWDLSATLKRFLLGVSSK